ncbi:unnamed protein product, partial [Effrenium voratum]
VVVDCCGLSYQTATLENRSSLAPWNEYCTWPNVSLHPQEFESSFVEFKVYARHWFTRNYLIGKASLQLSFVNKRQNHLYARRWLPLRRDESPAINGMLSVTVYVLKPGEMAPSLSLQTSESLEPEAQAKKDEEDGLESAVLTTSVDAPQGRAHYVRLNLIRVEDLQDQGGAPSPYVTVEFAGCLVKTSIGRNVKQYTFNECLQIPVVTPVYEDTIILKLWTCNWFSPDELMAQGLFSFSELNSHPLPPRWFNLYGWDSAEADLQASGDKEPNAHIFKGRLLLSGSVEPLDPEEELQPAKSVPARLENEPAMVQISILADVYMVTGAEGRQCQVEIGFGSKSSTTKWVSYDTEQLQDPSEGRDEFEDSNLQGDALGMQTFSFSERAGRVETLVQMTPEDRQSQPCLTITLFTSGYLQGPQRVASTKCSISEFPECDPYEPVKPRSIPLQAVKDGFSPSILLAVKTTRKNADDARCVRKPVKPMVYLLRAYCFGARRLQHSALRHDAEAGDIGLTVSCGGTSKRTEAVPGPRPQWMQPVELKILLCSDSTREAPATEPVTVSLWQGGQVTNTDLGKAVCVYSHMRRKDEGGRWEPYHLTPQWIKLFGDQGGGQHVGSVLIAFELMLFKHRHEPPLAPRGMWPEPPETFSRMSFCRLRRATLHFSLLGLRDMLPIPRLQSLGAAGGTVHISNPVVSVEVSSFLESGTGADPKRRSLEFRLGEGHHMDHNKKMKPWISNAKSLGTEAMNFDFLQAGKLHCFLPEKGLLEPYLVIRVTQPPSSMGASVGYGAYSVGEVLVTLEDKLPCCWLEGVTLSKSYEAQQAHIAQLARKSQDRAVDKEKFQQSSDEELRREMERRRKEEPRPPIVDADEPFIDPAGLPQPLREGLRRPAPTMPCRSLNMQQPASFSPRPGAMVKSVQARKAVQGKLEDCSDELFQSDFWFKSLRLSRNQDVLPRHDTRDWNYRPGESFGFVKCEFKLVDGWDGTGKDSDDGDMDDDDDVSTTGEMSGAALAVGGTVSEVDEGDQASEDWRLKSSFGLDPTLNSFAFSNDAMFERYRDPEHIPPRIRARLYFVKAVCIDAGSGLPNPYLDIQVGEHSISMRNMCQMQTNTPDFHRIEARDIQFPHDSRLEVTVKSLEDLALSDRVIGGTVIDLEDRWHSRHWQEVNRLQLVPIENRPLYSSEYPGTNRGSIEMWVEMIDSADASSVKPSTLARPPQTELEVRLVIWAASGVKLMNEESTNVQIKTQLDCKEYEGQYSAYQETDVHFNSQDGKAVFNWRMVYPRIKMPTTSCTLSVSLHHHEMMGSTFLGSFDLELKKYLERVARDLDAVTIGPSDIKCWGHEEEEEEVAVGSVTMTLYVLTQAEAQSTRAGIAREEPNENPQLLTPTEGRDWGTYLSSFGLAWPDFGLWKKMIPLMIALVIFLIAVIVLRQIGIL